MSFLARSSRHSLRALPVRQISSFSARTWRPTQRPRLSPPSHVRTFISSRVRLAVHAVHAPSKSTKLLAQPTELDLEVAEIDAKVLPPEEACLVLTDRAAEQLRTISRRKQNPSAALRVSVESGGCHGYQYKMELTTERMPEDYLFSHPDISPSNVIVDAVSLGLLKGSTIDFATELIGSSFRVLDNPQAKGSGCGCGVSWEAKL